MFFFLKRCFCEDDASMTCFSIFSSLFSTQLKPVQRNLRRPESAVRLHPPHHLALHLRARSVLQGCQTCPDYEIPGWDRIQRTVSFMVRSGSLLPRNQWRQEGVGDLEARIHLTLFGRLTKKRSMAEKSGSVAQSLSYYFKSRRTPQRHALVFLIFAHLPSPCAACYLRRLRVFCDLSRKRGVWSWHFTGAVRWKILVFSAWWLFFITPILKITIFPLLSLQLKLDYHSTAQRSII